MRTALFAAAAGFMALQPAAAQTWPKFVSCTATTPSKNPNMVLVTAYSLGTDPTAKTNVQIRVQSTQPLTLEGGSSGTLKIVVPGRGEFADLPAKPTNTPNQFAIEGSSEILQALAKGSQAIIEDKSGQSLTVDLKGSGEAVKQLLSCLKGF